jgi:peptidoglycan/xylan/chitin deacetylase (PgdA/CDA1 family)
VIFRPVALCKFLAFLALAMKPVRHGDRDRPVVALTFDACPTSLELDQEIIDVLREHDVPATLFLSGRWVEKHREETVELAKHFEIGNHGYAHDDARQGKLTYGEALRDIHRTQKIIEEVTGKRPRFYRPPAVKYNDEVLRAARDAGVRTILHDVASGDPDPNLKADKIVRYVLWKSKPGSIVIFHVNGKGWTTAETLPQIVAGLREKGYRLSTVGDLLAR